MSSSHTPSGAPAPSSPDHRPARRFHQSGLVQLFLIPLAVCLASLGVFYLFARISTGDPPARKVIAKIRNEGGNARWEAANELVRLAARDPKLLRDPAVVDALLESWKNAKQENPATRRVLALLLGRTVEVRDYFTLALGRTGDPRVAGVLLESLELPDDKDSGQGRIYALLALGNTGAPEALEPILRHSRDADPGLRTAAAFALGSLGPVGGEAAKARLKELLQDDSVDVRWNSALALARLRDAAGGPVLLAMTDRAALARVRIKTRALDPRTGARGEWKEYPLSEDRQRDAIVNGLKALALTGGAALDARLEGFIAADPDYQVREAALKLKQALPGIRKQLAESAAPAGVAGPSAPSRAPAVASSPR